MTDRSRKRRADADAWIDHAVAWFHTYKPELPDGAAPERVFELEPDSRESVDYDRPVRKWDDCRSYSKCLDYVAHLNWDQWTCTRCPAFHPADPTDVLEISCRVDDPADFLYSIKTK